MKCPNCGFDTENTANCPICGTDLTFSANQPTQTINQNKFEPNVPPMQPPYNTPDAAQYDFQGQMPTQVPFENIPNQNIPNQTIPPQQAYPPVQKPVMPKKRSKALPITAICLVSAVILAGFGIGIYSATSYNRNMSEVMAESISNISDSDDYSVITDDINDDSFHQYYDEEGKRDIGEAFSTPCADVTLKSVEKNNIEGDNKRSIYKFNFEIKNNKDSNLFIDYAPYLTIWDKKGNLLEPDGSSTTENAFTYTSNTLARYDDNVMIKPNETFLLTFEYIGPNKDLTICPEISIDFYTKHYESTYYVETDFLVPLSEAKTPDSKQTETKEAAESKQPDTTQPTTKSK